MCVVIVWICTDYGDLRVHVFCDKKTYDSFGKESQIITSSHRGDLDWVAGFVLGAQFGFLHVRDTCHLKNNQFKGRSPCEIFV